MLPSYEEVIGNIPGSEAWQEVEEYRARTIRRRNVHTVIGTVMAVVGIGLFWISGYEPEGKDYTWYFLGGIALFIASIIYLRKMLRRSRKQYSQYYKTMIVPTLLTNMAKKATYPPELAGKGTGFDCRFKADGYIEQDRLVEFPVFKKLSECNEYDGEDYFKGRLGVTDFELSEIHAVSVTIDSETHTKNRTTYFKGLVFIADFHKHFNGTTTIFTRRGKTSDHAHYVGDFMDTVSIEFDRMFNVMTTDELTTRYLLPVDMLERLVNLRKRFPKKGMYISLHEGKLMIAIHRVDFFEAKGLKKLDEGGIRPTYDEIRSILDIVDMLNLNTRIWGKQAEPAPQQSKRRRRS